MVLPQQHEEVFKEIMEGTSLLRLYLDLKDKYESLIKEAVNSPSIQNTPAPTTLK
jgi:hypothetical protein